jgi:hypothetical protein
VSVYGNNEADEADDVRAKEEGVADAPEPEAAGGEEEGGEGEGEQSSTGFLLSEHLCHLSRRLPGPDPRDAVCTAEDEEETADPAVKVVEFFVRVAGEGDKWGVLHGGQKEGRDEGKCEEAEAVGIGGELRVGKDCGEDESEAEQKEGDFASREPDEGECPAKDLFTETCEAVTSSGEEGSCASCWSGCSCTQRLGSFFVVGQRRIDVVCRLGEQPSFVPAPVDKVVSNEKRDGEKDSEGKTTSPGT